MRGFKWEIDSQALISVLYCIPSSVFFLSFYTLLSFPSLNTFSSSSLPPTVSPFFFTLSLKLLALQEKDVIRNIHFKFSYQFTILPLNSSSFLNPSIEYSILTSAVMYFFFYLKSVVQHIAQVQFRWVETHRTWPQQWWVAFQKPGNKLKDIIRGCHVIPPCYFSFHCLLPHFNQAKIMSPLFWRIALKTLTEVLLAK